jgi:hypothetical protein
MNNPNRLILVRPANFGYNSETAASNKFQNTVEIENPQLLALQEFDNMIRKLSLHDIDVLVLDDTATPIKPDAIFPNNWISFHPNGQSVLYPMEAKNRRIERRIDVYKLLPDFDSKNMIDLTHFENEAKFLEGTGSVIYDHKNKLAFCAISSRSNVQVFEELCQKLGFTPISFEAHDVLGHPIYHTNVLLSIGNKITVVCDECISNPIERAMVMNKLRESSNVVISIDFRQMTQFASNCLEVNNKSGQSFLIMSETAFQSLPTETINSIKKDVEIISVAIPTIEKIGGGSARCMILGV